MTCNRWSWIWPASCPATQFVPHCTRTVVGGRGSGLEGTDTHCALATITNGAGGQASKAPTPTAPSPSSPTRNPLCFSPWPYTRGALRSYGRVRAEGRSPMLERQSTSKLGVARCGAHDLTRQIIVHVALPPAPLCCRLSAWPCPLALALGCHDDELDAPPSSAGLKFAGKEGNKLA